ncbi:MAG: hypothetical protein H6Q90_5089 [Deltaproteobacteria bacterium]|nr:hypothetical protein [Deltaproteobacteria bacterium]
MALAAVCASAPTALAGDDAPPTAAQLDAAKKAFGEGKKLHDAGKLPEAIEKFKESFKLSKNPLLLYNIGLTMEEAGMEDLALFYYRKFLTEAPADAGQRQTVVDRVKVLEKKFSPNATTDTGKPDAGKPDVAKPDVVKQPVVIKPAGTYSATDFQHQIVDTAPPGKPLDVTAFVPEDSGFAVTLFFRTAGEGKFNAKPMKWRYKELVGRIPAPKMIGSSVQYYIEVKDQAGTVVTRSGKSTSPNQVLLEAGATPRFYPDITDDGEIKVTPKEVRARDDEDDPLNKTTKPVIKDPPVVEVHPTQPGVPGSGLSDVGSSKFKKAKWGTTIGATALVGFGIVSFLQAGKYARSLEEDSTQCGVPPCRAFSAGNDTYAADVEKTGRRWQTFSTVGIGLGIATGAVAGYFWYKELTAKKRGDLKASKSAPSPETSWVVAPTLDHGYAGAAAAVRF